MPDKNPKASSLADALVKAGLVSTGAREASETEKREEAARTRRRELERGLASGEPRAITRYFTADVPKDEPFEAAIARGNAWLDAMVRAGHRDALARDLEHCERTVELAGDPITADQVAAIEQELGFALPPSYRLFLTTVGQVRFLNPWWDETTAPDALVAETRRWVDSERALLDRLLPAGATEHAVYVCDFHNNDAHYFLSCAERNAAGESPIHLVYHDEPELYGGTFGFVAWFSEKVTRAIDEETDRLLR